MLNFILEQLRLYRMVYKTDENSVSLTGDLWAFRPILNLEHVSQSLKALDNPQKHALLAYFLDNVSSCMFVVYTCDYNAVDFRSQ